MPPKRRNVVSKTTTIITANNSRASPTKLPGTGKTSSGKNARVLRKGPSRNTGPSIPSIVRQYGHTVIDPFSIGPVRLGAGTLVPTQLATIRGSQIFTISSNTFVELSLIAKNSALSNSAQSPVNWNATSVTPSWQYAAAPVAYAAMALQNQCRWISAGMRLTPTTAATDKPLIVYAGNFPPPSSLAAWLALAPTDRANSEFNNLFVARTGESVAVTWRPEDSTDSDLIPVASGTVNGSVPYMYVSGALNQTFLLEYVANVEYTTSTTGQLTYAGQELNQATLSEFGTPQEIRRHLDAAGLPLVGSETLSAPSGVDLIKSFLQGGIMHYVARMGN